jgi:alcohol dehydrogenase, propanol-preferring
MRAMILKQNCEIKAKLPAECKTAGKAVKKEEEDKESNYVESREVKIESGPLELADVPVPVCGPEEILIKVYACGVCRTELDQVEGRISPPRMPVILGHQPVGIVAEAGASVKKFMIGDRVGATWLYSSCGKCKFCIKGFENLCEQFKATGCNANGGYAEFMVIGQDFTVKIPEYFTDLSYAAPLMCSGVVGYRSLKLCGMEDGKTFGLYGFGSANHLVLQMANFLYPASKKYVISRNIVERDLALNLGADWAGDIEESTPKKLDCAIDTTPAWKPVLYALENLQKGGRLVLNLIRKEDRDKEYLLRLDYPKHLWLEKEIKTVANVTKKDAGEFLELAARMKLRPQIKTYKLEDANLALAELKAGLSTGSKILRILPV